MIRRVLSSHVLAIVVMGLLAGCGEEPAELVNPQSEPPPPPPVYSYRSLGQNHFQPGCLAVFEGNACTASEKTVKSGNRCVDGTVLLKRWGLVNNKAAKSGECSAEATDQEVDCNNACELNGNLGGICVTVGVNCFGEFIDASYCSCEVRKSKSNSSSPQRMTSK